MKYILTDVDEVLLNWIDAFEKWFEETRGWKPEMPLRQIYSVMIWLDCSEEEEAFKLMEEFDHTRELFSDLKPYDGTQETVWALSQQGYRFIAITAVSSTPSVYQYRMENLQKYYSDVFEELHCVGLGGDKSPILERFQPTYWLEDNARNAEKGFRLGHKTFLVNQPYNLWYENPEIIRVNDLREILPFISP